MDREGLSKVGRPLTREEANILQYHFLCRWLVFLVHSCVLFICVAREWEREGWREGRRADRKSSQGKSNWSSFPSKNTHWFSWTGWEGFTCGLTLERRVNFTAGRWRNLRSTPQKNWNKISHLADRDGAFFTPARWRATTCFSDGLCVSNTRRGSSLARTPPDTPLSLSLF